MFYQEQVRYSYYPSGCKNFIVKRGKGTFRFVYPKRGTVALLLAIGLGYFLVEHAATSLAETMGPAHPGLFLEPMRTLALGFLAWIGITAIFVELYRQYEANPRTFKSVHEIRNFHVAKRFDSEQYMTNSSIAILGAVMVLYGWPEFISIFEETVHQFILMYVVGGRGEIPPLHFFWQVIYLGGFAAFALSLDRVIVAFLRDLRIKLLQRQLIRKLRAQ